jgi:hypothetical protein
MRLVMMHHFSAVKGWRRSQFLTENGLCHEVQDCGRSAVTELEDLSYAGSQTVY